MVLDAETAKAEHDRLEVGVEATRRDRNHLPLERVAGEAPLAAELLVAHDRLVVDVLGGDVHEREIVGALVRHDVLGGDVVDVLLHPCDEGAAAPLAFLVVRGLEEATEVLEGELRIDRDEALAQTHDGVHPLAAAEGVLQGVVLDRQHLRKEIGEPELTQPAAELRGAEDVLEARHVAFDLVDPERAGRRAFVCLVREVVGFKGERHKPSYRSVIPYVQLSR